VRDGSGATDRHVGCRRRQAARLTAPGSGAARVRTRHPCNLRRRSDRASHGRGTPRSPASGPRPGYPPREQPGPRCQKKRVPRCPNDIESAGAGVDAYAGSDAGGTATGPGKAAATAARRRNEDDSIARSEAERAVQLPRRTEGRAWRDQPRRPHRAVGAPEETIVLEHGRGRALAADPELEALPPLCRRVTAHETGGRGVPHLERRTPLPSAERQRTRLGLGRTRRCRQQEGMATVRSASAISAP